MHGTIVFSHGERLKVAFPLAKVVDKDSLFCSLQVSPRLGPKVLHLLYGYGANAVKHLHGKDRSALREPLPCLPILIFVPWPSREQSSGSDLDLETSPL
jgi:hypothetical protein